LIELIDQHSSIPRNTMDTLVQDLRLGLRLLWKERAFSSAVILTLALCFGANVALFSVVYHVLLRPLPMPDSGRLVMIGNAYPKAGVPNLRAVAVPDYFDRLRETTAFQEQALFNNASINIEIGGVPTRVRALNVTPSFFRVLGVAPLRGRTFTDDEGEVGRNQRLVLSYGLWQSAYGGEPQVIGRDVRLDGQTYTIVGVMPPGFAYPQPNVMLWRPIAFTPQQKSDQSRHSNNFQQIARLKTGATIDGAQREIDVINTANLDRFPQFKQIVVDAGFHTTVTNLQDDIVRDVKGSLYLLWGGALFVLVIGGVNVANLVLARSRARLRELSTRVALGAGRARIARQLTTESLVLTLIAAIAGVGLGWAALRLLTAINLQDLPRGADIRLDGVAVVVALAAGGLIGILLGLIPLAGVKTTQLATFLREEGRGGTSGRGAQWLRRALIVTQIAFAFILLAGAGLLTASFQNAMNVDPGFRAGGLTTATVILPRARYRDNAAMFGFLNESLQRLRAVPGVTSAGTTDLMPLSGNNNASVIFAEGHEMKSGESPIAATQSDVSPGYFEAMGATLVKGRFFNDNEHVMTTASPDGTFGPQPHQAVVDDRLARRFWPGQDPVGRRMYLPTDSNNLTAITPRTVFIEVVGVVHELKVVSLTQRDEAVGACYFPIAQMMPSQQAQGIAFNYAIRTAGDPTALAGIVRSTIASLDRELAVSDMFTMSERVDRSLTTRRSPMVLAVSFGAIGVFLAAIGIYGVLAYVVAQRTREIGVRMALGATRGSIFSLILREGLILLMAGFLVGAAGAFAIRRALESQLFGVSATDPFVLTLVTITLALVTIAACTLPARRATNVEPIIALAE
jgi:predicted permease